MPLKDKYKYRNNVNRHVLWFHEPEFMLVKTRTKRYNNYVEKILKFTVLNKITQLDYKL